MTTENEALIKQAIEFATTGLNDNNPQYAEHILGFALKEFPDNLELVVFLALSKMGLHKWDEARDLLTTAHQMKPDDAAIADNLGLAESQCGNKQAAIDLFCKAIELKDDHAPAWEHLAMGLNQDGQSEKALKAIDRGIKTEDKSSLRFNKAHIYGCLRKPLEAIAEYRKAILIDDNSDSKFNMSLQLLITGQWEEGWQNYEERFNVATFKGQSGRRAKLIARAPELQKGAELKGKRLLLYSPQGEGDKIQMLRYCPRLKQLGATLLFECPKSLQDLCRPLVDELVDDPFTATFDYHIDLMSLPFYFNTRQATVPKNIPYIFDNHKPDPLGDRIKKRIGVCWGGNPQHANDCNRSCYFKYFEPVAKLPDTEIISLQFDTRKRHWKGIGDIDLLEGVDFPYRVVRDETSDFGHLASVMANCDLIISVDTSVAHLAGAMGLPVAVILPYHCDWRYGLEGNRCTWYPTMRLYRQDNTRSFEQVLKLIASDLDNKDIQF